MQTAGDAAPFPSRIHEVQWAVKVIMAGASGTGLMALSSWFRRPDALERTDRFLERLINTGRHFRHLEMILFCHIILGIQEYIHRIDESFDRRKAPIANTLLLSGGIRIRINASTVMALMPKRGHRISQK